MSEKPAEVISAAISQLGSPYVFGAWGEFCTPKNRGSRVREDHPATKDKCQVLNGSASNCEGCKWQGDRMFDCRGFTKWCLEQVGVKIAGQGATSQYNDESNWLERGQIDNMPECVCCVFVDKDGKKAHTGLYIGDNLTVEASVTVKRQSLAQKWTHYAIPKGLYTAEEIAEIRETAYRPMGTLRKGSRGETVKKAQELLKSYGYNCGTVDGIFGAKTFEAVKAFQYDHGLIADGIIGENTWSALLACENPHLYTATISHLTYQQISSIISQFPDAVIAAEGNDGDE